MSRIAVVSDSHDRVDNLRKFAELARREGLDTVVHAGDIVSPFALRELKGFKLYGVFGNNDGEKLLLSRVAAELGATLVEQPLFATIGGYEVAVIHGASTTEWTLKLVEALARSGLFRAVIYGHTHRLDVRKLDRTLIVNPGPLSGYLADKGTFAIVDLEALEVEVVEVE